MSNLFVTDYIIRKSAKDMDRQRLFSSIYETIHGLGSMCDVVDQMILSDAAKKKAYNLKNKVQFQMWKYYESELFFILKEYYDVWYKKFAKNVNYFETTNFKNLLVIRNYLQNNIPNFHYKQKEKFPSWITDELIQTHRSVLIQKEIEKEKEYKKSSLLKIIQLSRSGKYNIPEKTKDIKQSIFYHYRNLWPNTPTNLKMRYDFRKDNK